MKRCTFFSATEGVTVVVGKSKDEFDSCRLNPGEKQSGRKTMTLPQGIDGEAVDR